MSLNFEEKIILKENLKIGMKLIHKFRGSCNYSRTASYLEASNPNGTSLFVEFISGELIEVSLNLVEKDKRITL